MNDEKRRRTAVRASAYHYDSEPRQATRRRHMVWPLYLLSSQCAEEAAADAVAILLHLVPAPESMFLTLCIP